MMKTRISLYQWSWILALGSFILRLPGFFVDLPPFTFVDEGIYINGIYSIALSSWGWAPYNYLAGGVNYYIPAILISFLHFLHVPFDMTSVVLFSRFIGPGILSCCSIPLTYLIGVRLFRDEKLALFAAGILAFSPLMLGVSRIWYPDHYAVIFSVLALFSATKIITEEIPKKLDYILLGIAIGLCASTKYNGLFFIFLIPITHLISTFKEPTWKQRLRFLFFTADPWLAGFFVIISFILTNPWVFKDWARYLDAIQSTKATYLAGSPGLMVANTPVFYSTLLLFTTFGILGSIAILIGAFALIRRNTKAAAILILMPIIFIAFMSQYKNAFDRNISVLVPYMCLLLASGFLFFQKKFSPQLLIIILIFFIAEPSTRIILNTIHDLRPDSREIATAWMDKNIPSHSVIGLGISVYNKTRGLPLDEKKFDLVELPLPPTSPKKCIEYYFLDQWTYTIFGKGKSVFYSPYFSENIFRNTGGYYFKKEHEGIDLWLAQFQEIHQIRGFNYGPDISIYKRKTPC